MEKGVFILFIVFVIVGAIHYISLKMMAISEAKKTRFRKLFWYFYGVVFALSGGINLIEKGSFYWSFALQLVVGLVIILLNFLGKIDSKTS